MLDVHTGRLWAEPRAVDDGTGPYYDPRRDLWRQAWRWDHAPRLLAFDASVRPWTQTHKAIHDQLTRIAPAAQALVDALAPVADTNREYDWTPAATAAHDRIHTGTYTVDPCHVDWDAPLPDRHRDGVVGFTEVVDIAPQIVDPSWAVMGDAELDRIAQAVAHGYRPGARFITQSVRDAVAERFQFRSRTPIHVVGARIGLREVRARLLEERTGMPARPASEHFAGALPTGLAPGSSDAQLADLAAHLEADAAHRDKVTLLGTTDYLRTHRAALRDAVRAQLSVVGGQWKELDQARRLVGAQRAALIAQVLSFGEAPEWGGDGKPAYAAIGEAVHMKRQSAKELIDKILSAVDEAATDVPDGDEESGSLGHSGAADEARLTR